MSFEVKYNDLCGRIGKLETLHGTLDTPVFIPVIHPVKQLIDINFIKKIGFKAVITNAYIAWKYYGDEAKKRGIHKIINFDDIVMTDSGGYQVLEYGEVKVKPTEMAEFETDIRTDIAVPLDKPTGYGLDYNNALGNVEQTIKNVQETSNIIKKNKSMNQSNEDSRKIDIVWAGPVQGAEHLDLVKRSALSFDKMGFNLMALGSPVELMEAYEFATLSRIIYTLKKVIPSKPIHLFGAGHPLTIPLAVALGCDMFDSASYILYARDNRYLYSNGTTRLDGLTFFPCSCPICNSFSPKELLSLDETSRTIELAKHNLYVLKTEVNSVKNAILEGRLWEYLMSKAHCHPKLMEAVRLLKEFDNLAYGTSIFKEKAIYFTEPYDQHRPEARRFREMITKYEPKEKFKLILYPETKMHPFYTSKEYSQLKNKFPKSEIFSYNPYLGLIPSEVSDIFPASQNLNCYEYDSNSLAEQYPTFVNSLIQFLDKNKKEEIIIVANNFMKQVIYFINSKFESQTSSYNVKICNYEENFLFERLEEYLK
ncbi:MAG: tRNA guanosine(15) transglycosylase TgtA [Nitrososphaeraceae archaeon]|nr:tRNA guanosine(15) transglycosylase TgtA [Nitrososphaeraceae archaeon]